MLMTFNPAINGWAIFSEASLTACRVMAKRLRDVCALPESEPLWRAGRGFVVRDLPIPTEMSAKGVVFEIVRSRWCRATAKRDWPSLSSWSISFFIRSFARFSGGFSMPVAVPGCPPVV